MFHMHILGVKVDSVTRNEAIAKITSFLDEPKQHFITTPNPEIILFAHKHPDYRDIINKSDLALPDGIGLLWAARFMHEPLKERVSGTDMVPEICRLAGQRGLKIALLGGKDQTVLIKTAMAMRTIGAEVVYAEHGVTRERWDNAAFHDKIVDELRATSPELVFAAFGHPKQEQWIDDYRLKLPTVRLFIGCGGALDFISGSAKRAPTWVRSRGLEWLWRLITQPKRIKRIFNAVIVFPLTVIYVSWKK